MKSKWKNLRDYFRNECKKVGTSRSGSSADASVSSSWPYFKQLLFLKDILRPDRRDSNLTQNEPVEETEEGSMDDDNETQASEAGQDSHYTQNSEPPSPISVANDHSSRESSISRSKRAKRCRPDFECIAKKNDEIIAIEKQKLEILEREQNLTDDDDLCFFKSLLPHMKKLPSTTKLRIRSKMQELVLTELEALDRPQNPVQKYPLPPVSHITTFSDVSDIRNTGSTASYSFDGSATFSNIHQDHATIHNPNRAEARLSQAQRFLETFNYENEDE